MTASWNDMPYVVALRRLRELCHIADDVVAYDVIMELRRQETEEKKVQTVYIERPVC